MNKGIERIKIGIIGLGVGAGTGFITTCLAGELGLRRASFTESCKQATLTHITLIISVHPIGFETYRSNRELTEAGSWWASSYMTMDSLVFRKHELHSGNEILYLHRNFPHTQ